MWLGGLLVVVMASLFAVPHFIDWNGYRGVFETQASRILGREVRVGGEVNVRFLPTPYVRFERIRIAESSDKGFGGRSFFRAEDFTMWLSVPPLLKGLLEANEVELNRPSLRLAVDEQGRGNWRTFEMTSGALPFVPAGVSLQAVNITDGIITYDTADGKQGVRIVGLNGKFSARSLKGPYKFIGSMNWDGRQQNVRLSTFDAVNGEAGQQVPVRLQVKPDGTDNTYVVEGNFSDFLDVTKFEGGLKADIALQKSAVGQSVDPTKDGARPHVALLAKLSATTTKAQLSTLVASFEDVGQPQIITGEARVSYGLEKTVDIDLQSRWLDLDRLLAPQASSAEKPPENNTSPLKTLTQSAPMLAGILPQGFQASADVQIEQVQLGGKAVSGIRVALRRQDDVLRLQNLAAGLPGSARLKASGVIGESSGPGGDAASSDQKEFSGSVFVGGPSMLKTIRWGLQRETETLDFTDGAFSFSGDIEMTPGELQLQNVAAEFSGRPLRGSLLWRGGGEQRLDVDLEAHEIDARWFGVDRVDLPTARQWLGKPDDPALTKNNASAPAETPDGAIEATREQAGAVTQARLLAGEIDRAKIRIKAGRFNNGSEVLRDVDVQLTARQGLLDIEALRFQSDAGLTVSVAGELQNAAREPTGQLNWEISAPGPAGISQIAHLLGLPDKDHETVRLSRFLQSLSPLDLAGTVSFGQRAPSAVDFQADGLARSGRAIFSGKLDAGWKSWRTAPIEFSMALENEQITHVASLLLGAGVPESQASRLPGKITLKGVGVAEKELLVASQLSARNLTSKFTGQVTVSEDGLRAAEGHMKLETENVQEVLRLAGLPVGGGVRSVPASGKITLAYDDGAWVYWPEKFKVGGENVSGSIALLSGVGAPGVVGVAGKLKVSSVSVESLFKPFLRDDGNDVVTGNEPAEAVLPQTASAEKSQSKSPDGVAQPIVTQNVFVDQPFDLTALRKLTGNLDLQIGALHLGDGLVLNDTTATLEFLPSELALKKLSGTTSEGQLTAAGRIVAGRAGAKLSGSLDLENVNLAYLIPSTDPNSKPMAAGSMNVSFRARGQGLSPGGLIASLQGEGESQIADVVIGGLSPAAVNALANSILRETSDGANIEVNAKVSESLTLGEMIIKKATLPIKIIDGALQFAQFTARTRQGELRNKTTVDLNSLSLDSEWRIKPVAEKKKVTAGSKVKGTPLLNKPWPEVGVTYVGRLAALGQLGPQVDTADLEREMAVRKIQRNVDELERLRLEDERRAAEERARKKKREEELARQAEQEDALDAAETTGGGEQGGVPEGQAPSSDDGVTGTEPVEVSEEAAAAAAKREAELRAKQRRARARRRKQKTYRPPPSPFSPF